MPTHRIFSDERNYKPLGDEVRYSISVDLCLATSVVLEENLEGIEAFWFPPFELASASNTVDFSVDVEFSMLVSDETINRLGDRLLGVFDHHNGIVPGKKYGIWIKTPYIYRWFERTKT